MEAPEHGTTMDTPDERLTAFGYQLIDVHHWLREELAALREGVDAYLAGGLRPRELRTHCLTFCSALTRHHTGEDADAFPRLAERFPELRPVLDELRRDHRLVEDSLQRLEALLGGLDRHADPVGVRTELDSLAALMETHFVYEEKRIVSALNALNAPGWNRSRPDFLHTDDAER
ncbi:hemerythrin domain-containing protein [Microtetraspora sp. AC03309]|uniref:hemerythrin domain-containing protein n=1 Tax=Microtetraspora sp. AC03309 TaxID=2779376 RepID=UPI001E2B5EB9|nr:hemerythrin domain-containing protein [Microtetraspora sp. AC03309]